MNNDYDTIGAWMIVIMILLFGACLGFISGYLYVVEEAGYCVAYNEVITVKDCIKVQGW